MNRNPAVWGADAESFRPERWLEMDKMPTPYEYPVFNAGRQRHTRVRMFHVVCLAQSAVRFRTHQRSVVGM